MESSSYYGDQTTVTEYIQLLPWVCTHAPSYLLGATAGGLTPAGSSDMGAHTDTLVGSAGPLGSLVSRGVYLSL